jgi:low temperature requirement protein LtrA
MTESADAVRRTGSVPWRRPMQARDRDEAHRPSTTLELLFDLTFVVAVSVAASELAAAIEADQVASGLGKYAMVFFAIWWAWMNFSWFASAFDVDDVPYRLMTLVQMGGVLILAAGLAPAFESNDFTTVVIGYVIMRIALVAQWLRAGRSDRTMRATCLRYASGVAVVQLGWIGRLWLPDQVAPASFLALAAAELLVPVWAERASQTPYHPGHITERYEAFTIIVLGECVLSSTVALQAARGPHGVSLTLVVTGMISLVLLFALWWIYFLHPSADGLRAHPENQFWWGYGHYAVFASLAALGAGLDVIVAVTADHRGREFAVSERTVGLVVAGSISVFLLVFGSLQRVIEGLETPGVVHFAGASLLLFSCALLAGPAGLQIALALMTVVLAGLVTVGVVSKHRAAIASG